MEPWDDPIRALLNSGAKPVGEEAQSSKHDAVRPSARCHHLNHEGPKFEIHSKRLKLDC